MQAFADRRYRVLISAYACNPYKGSEEGVGWGWVKAIARHHELWVITAAFHRPDIEKAVAEEPDGLAHVRFCYVPHQPWHYAPTPKWLRIEMSCLKPLMNLAYAAWLKDAYRLGVQLHQENQFDLIHQLTYVAYRFPGHLWKLGTPFVWGPIGGFGNVRWRFLSTLGLHGAIHYGGRNIINLLQKSLLRKPKQAFRKAGAQGGIIAATDDTRAEIRRWYGQDSEVLCEIGLLSQAPGQPSQRQDGEPLKIVWSGFHYPGKGLPFLLTALSRLPRNANWQLSILGQGPYTARWQQLAENLGVNGRGHWLGQLPRQEAVSVMRQARVLVITSVHDLTSTVLLEALSQGVPVICPDYAGFATVVTEDCGIKVPLSTPQQFVGDLSTAILTLTQSESLRRRLAEGALIRARDYTWDEKAWRIDAIYRKVVESSASTGRCLDRPRSPAGCDE
jgi:glycosyltransferase involved in cell wall biosynthesis